MAFIRRKVVGGREYRYEVESYRTQEGTVRQRVLRYLGPEAPIYGTGQKRKGPQRTE